MDHPDSTYRAAVTLPRKAVRYGLQPTAIVLILWYWAANPTDPMVFPLVLVSLHIVLGVLERMIPARPGWLVSARTQLLNIFLVVLLTMGIGVVGGLYDDLLREPLSALRATLHLDIWPHHWPLLAQLFMVFFASEFIWYWVHRAEHRWQLVWRLSGHGAHHSFKRLSALNFGLNHPLEFFLLVLPAALVELTFGVGPAAAGAAILGVSQASIAHSNLDLNTKVVGWLFTTNRYHIHHHSMVLEESNTNYGCSAIVWDRLFGTFADAGTLEAGTGPTEPSLWGKFLMPLREPSDTAIAPD
ncbi:MAG: fatty acid hydroxylase family protein [Gammaproteobacteria bacterium]|jgi:sterol desaturase/sphingolipid hydroxylase (fatty acid hydroxylase superfamily)|nr:MAG: fatty acid hydroxylase family protein [Gammaproteobacteria bacterium]